MLARQLLADPEYPNKVKEGRVSEVVWCDRNNVCLRRLLMNMPVRCHRNPRMGQESRRGRRAAPARPRPPGARRAGGARADRIAAADDSGQQGHRQGSGEEERKGCRMTGLTPGTFGLAVLADDDRVSHAIVRPDGQALDIPGEFPASQGIYGDWERSSDRLLQLSEPPVIAPPFLVARRLRGPVGDGSIVGRMVPQPLVATPRA